MGDLKQGLLRVNNSRRSILQGRKRKEDGVQGVNLLDVKQDGGKIRFRKRGLRGGKIDLFQNRKDYIKEANSQLEEKKEKAACCLEFCHLLGKGKDWGILAFGRALTVLFQGRY